MDNQGAVEGIGSRFFTVSNGAGALTAVGDGLTAVRPTFVPRQSLGWSSQRRLDVDIESISLDDSAMVGRRGWDLNAPLRAFEQGASGRTIIRSEEVNRVELQLGKGWHEGYLRTSEGLVALPVGSRLDGDTGVFTWAPGVGFVGTYDLLFVRWDGMRAVARREVRVILAPKGRGHVGVQVAIDLPREREDVNQPFVIAGWAADLDATVGTGIDTLHVWAYPLGGGPPVFLGATAYGGIRPDVAAVYGDEFRASGFGVTVQGLEPGSYDLAVFPWSNVVNGFGAAKLVRVSVQ